MGLKRVVAIVSVAFLVGMIASIASTSLGVGVAVGIAVGIYESLVINKEN